MGLNLSDRLYIAGDTRVTHSDGTHSDDVLKLVPLLDRSIFPDNEIGMAVAGNVAIATFFKEKISEGLRCGSLSPDIRKFREEIKPFLEQSIVDWVNSGKPYVNCCILFGGVFKGRRKNVNLIKLQELVKDFKDSIGKDNVNLIKAEESLKDDPIFKILDQKIKEGTGKGAMSHIEESRIPYVPKEIEDAINSGSGEINYPDSLIFSTRVEVSSKTVLIESAEWGEFLAYGDRVKKENISSGLLANLELYYARKKGEFIMGAAILTSTILDYASDFEIRSIGGTVIIMPIDERGASISGKDLVMQPQNTHLLLNGVRIPLVPFFHYHKKMKAGMDLVAKNA